MISKQKDWKSQQGGIEKNLYLKDKTKDLTCKGIVCVCVCVPVLSKENSERFTWYEYFIKWETNCSWTGIIQTPNWYEVHRHDLMG